MFRGIFLNRVGTTRRIALTSIILIVNAFVWYSYAFTVLREIANGMELTYLENLGLWATNIVGAAIFALVGAFIANKLDKRIPFLMFWMLLGTVSSFVALLVGAAALISSVIVFFLFGVSFGLGMPACMAYYADCTLVENRARFGGIIFLIIGLGTLGLNLLELDSLTSKILVLAVWRGFGLLALFFIKPHEEHIETSQKVSYSFIVSQRSFLLYFIPWVMFCLVNYASARVMINFFGDDFVRFSTMVEGILIGVFAVVGGFFSDRIGRKRVTIAGFVMLGLGYAVLGIYPESLLSWYFYTVVDGVAWGVFYTLFFTTLWGDLAYGARSEKYYALGGLPFLFSSFTQLIIGQYVAETILMYTIFSLASFFLFLAVLPLMYAPETLPEKKIRDRELKQYIEKAKKAKEKYT